MKTQIKIMICVTVFITVPIVAMSQFQQIPATADSWRTTGTVGEIGIGQFENGTNLPSALTIDGSLLPLAAMTGEVFRTNAPNIATFWRMLRGGTEYGRIYNNNDNHFYFEAPSGDLIFNSGGTTTRMRINNAGDISTWNNFFIDEGNNNTGTIANSLRFGSFSGEGIGSNRFFGNPNWNGLDFYTNSTNRMIIQNDGRVGINTMVIAPNSQFEVNNDINLTTSVLNHGYRIADVIVLQRPGVNNTFVGQNAGINNTGNATDNTFVGFNAGVANNGAIANANTFIGSRSGETNTEGRHNTFVGWSTGQANTTGRWNTFTGMLAGRWNTTGDANSFYGKQAGFNTTTGGGNCFFGSHAAHANTTGLFNIAIGIDAANAPGLGFNLGDNSIFIGTNADQAVAGLNNAIVIGANAIVTNDNQMILGDNQIDVGIGLSNDPAGPQNKLEINTGAARPDESGLRFRQLTSASPTVGPSGGRVLSVDANGDVILVDDEVAPPGLGDVTACATHNPANDENFITKWINTGSPSPEICRTMSIFENNAGLVGINNNAPVYNFNNHGNAMFSPEPPPASPYATWNGGQYPLAEVRYVR